VYERARPDYPAEALDWILARLELTAGAQVVDVGAGTGKFARQLLARGMRVTAVEPLQPMREVLARVVPDVQTVEGTAEQIPLPDRTAQAVTAAQSFHWFDPERALPEMHRVLEPRGGLALLWNVRDETNELHQTYAETIRPYHAGAYPEQGDHAGALERPDLFDDFEAKTFRHVQLLDADGLAARAASVSFIARLPEDERAELLERVRALGPEGQFEFPYLTKVFTCRRR
jgi:ubiquinone/menaquinone biosynthesis C-methylase UbiE